MGDIFFFTSLLIFLGVNLLYTQIVYEKGYISLIMIASILLPITTMIAFPREGVMQTFPFSLLLSYYSVLLFLIKKFYKKINSFLVNLHIVDIKYKGKEFTYVNWNSSNPTTPMWWDKKLTTKPSVLDIGLTFVLIGVPFLLCGMTSFILKEFFQ